MADRGLKSGVASNYFYTWLFEADGRGGLKISEPIAHHETGDEDNVSVTEVSLAGNSMGLALSASFLVIGFPLAGELLLPRQSKE